MASFILIFLCLILGWTFRTFRIFPENAFVVLNRFVIYVSLPALSLVMVHRLELSSNLFVPVSMAWIQFVLAVLFFIGIGKLTKLSGKTVGALILTAGLGNTAFVGFPLLVAIYGKEVLGMAVLVDQPGTFLVASTVGVATAAFFSGRKPDAWEIAKKVLTFPPFLFLMIAFALRPMTFPDVAFEVLDRLSSTLVPLALVSVGMQLRVDGSVLREKWRWVVAGLGFKLVLSPAFFFVFYRVVLGETSPISTIAIVQAAMAPMVTSGILAEEYGLDSKLASLMIGVGIPLSLATVPLLAKVLG